MRSRVANLLNWRRVLRLTSGVALVGGTVAGIGTVSLAAASCWTINRIRPRTYTDDYHLNPEILRMPYRNVEFSANDGVNLKGWWVPATVHGRESNRIVILMHPYNNHKSNLLGVASSLWYHGYSVFMFDFRSFAASPKTRQTIGYLEQFDAVAAINYVKNNYYYNKNVDDDDIYHKKQIVLMGASMGGACAICASQSFHDDDIISAIVTDCTFSSLRAICKYRIGIAAARWFPVGLLNLVVNIMDIGNQFIYGYGVDDVSPIDVVSNDDFNIPLLLLHSECDAVVPFAHSQKLYTKCNSKIKNLYCIKSGDHCGGYFINPKLFTKYLCHWVDDVLDHEILERKDRKKQQQLLVDLNEEEPTNVVINNEFIMFDAQDDIGINEQDEIENDTDNNKQNMIDTTNDINRDNVENEGMDIDENSNVIIDGVNDGNTKNNTIISIGNTDERPQSTLSSIMSYFGTFLKK